MEGSQMRISKIRKFIGMLCVLTLVSVSAVGCLGGPKQTGGSLLGAAAGGLLGSQFGGGSGKLAMTEFGALAGLFIGSEIGKSMDEVDQQLAARRTQYALEETRSGTASRWDNPDTGNWGTITPTTTSFDEAGTPCREFVHEVRIGGDTEQMYGTACRQADGSWKIIQ